MDDWADIEVKRDGFGPVEWVVRTEATVRKRHGVFFTPWMLARHLASGALAAGLPALPTICDPFVGAGVLLAAAVEVMHGADPAAGRRRRLATCYGVDLSPSHLDHAARLLNGGGGLDLAWGSRLKAFDSLSTPIEGGWHQMFPEVFAAGGFDLIVSNPPWEKVRVNDREFFSAFDAAFPRMTRARRDVRRVELLGDAAVAAAYHAYCERVAALKSVAASDYETVGGSGDMDQYKLAAERCCRLLKPGGVAALIVPHGLLGDMGARNLRRWLLDHFEWVSLTRMETGRELFPEVHANLGVIALVLRKNRAREGAEIALSRAVTRARDLPSAPTVALPARWVDDLTEHQMVPLIDGPEDMDFLSSCAAFPRLGDWPESRFKPRREIDMTNDRLAFRTVGSGVPLLEGKHLAAYATYPERRGRDVVPSRARHLTARRIAWRAVADRAMRRRLVASAVPVGVALGNSLIFTCAEEADEHALLYLLAYLNSRVADAQLRLWCANNNINIFHLKACRAPPFDPASSLHRRLVASAGELCRRSAAPEWSVRVRANQYARLASDAIIDEQDAMWRELFGLAEDTWRRSVLSRTTAVQVH